MSTEDESKLAVLKERLNEGAYHVDASQVAVAILKRPGGLSLFQLRPDDARDRQRAA